MRISSLRINNFRNFGDFKIDFEKAGALIFGRNGLGKTNLMEAITFFSLGRSFRSISDKDCILFNQEKAQINSDFVVNNNQINIDFILDSKNKNVKINNKRINRLSELYNYVKVVYFSPDDIQIISGSPKMRRRFFDIAISQSDFSYLNLSAKYNHLLKQRNIFLKQENPDLEEKKYWDLEFAKLSTGIINSRLQYLEKFEKKLATSYQSIASEELKIQYTSSFKINKKIVETEQLIKQLEAISSKELMMQRSLIGPHLADYRFLINGRDARDFGSQGQKRSLAIAMRLVQAQMISAAAHDNPILIFDDVLVDLDHKRNINIIQQLNNAHQIFIATPNKFIYDYIHLPEIDLEKMI